MNNIKIIFFDVDGTLIEQKKHISPNTVETLKKLQENGIKIVIASGRSPFQVPVIDGVTFDAYMTFNGSLCYTSDKKTIYSNSLDRGDVHTIIENAARIDKPVAIATKDKVIANGSDEDLREYFAFGRNKLPVNEIEFKKTAAEETIYQMMISGRKTDYDTLLMGSKEAKVAAWWDRAVDIIPTSGGKGVGVEQILNYFEIPTRQSAAFGDGNNDLAMFEKVGYGIAMGNASDELKEAASNVTADVAHDGIYQYCKKHDLI